MRKTSRENFNDQVKGSKLPGLFKNLEPNAHLLHLSVLRQLNNKRAGTASTKTRAEVRGGGKKPWKQKGTGRARAGSIRSPLWTGGGISFGPKPRSYKLNLSRKERNLAIAQAITSRASDIEIIKKLPELKQAKTKEIKAQIKSLGLKTPLLLVAESQEAGFLNIKRASNNLQDVLFIDQKHIGTFEIMKANVIAITESALKELEKRFSRNLKARSVN